MLFEATTLPSVTFFIEATRGLAFHLNFFGKTEIQLLSDRILKLAEPI